MQRKSIQDIEPGAYKAMLGMEQYIKNSQLQALLREMIKIRASQINGCAYSIDMHTQEALKIGEISTENFCLVRMGRIAIIYYGRKGGTAVKRRSNPIK